MELRPVGISGVLCEFGSEIRDDVSAQVSALARAVMRSGTAGVVECVPGYASLLVSFDPLITDAEEVSALLKRLSALPAKNTSEAARVVKIPVCYGGDFGPDLAYVASHAGLSCDEVIGLHSGRDYRIYMLGFLPGFPYLGGLDQRLHTPRLAVPRSSIPAGSVGIGGQQTGIYPMASPGGWQLIGRTPLKLFRPGKPLPYHAGDAICFVPIDRQTYAELEAEQDAD